MPHSNPVLYIDERNTVLFYFHDWIHQATLRRYDVS